MAFNDESVLLSKLMWKVHIVVLKTLQYIILVSNT